MDGAARVSKSVLPLINPPTNPQNISAEYIYLMLRNGKEPRA
jgi:hypothetical protein